VYFFGRAALTQTKTMRCNKKAGFLTYAFMHKKKDTYPFYRIGIFLKTVCLMMILAKHWKFKKPAVFHTDILPCFCLQQNNALARGSQEP
jgi:hypothetical protein